MDHPFAALLGYDFNIGVIHANPTKKLRSLRGYVFSQFTF